MRRQRGGHRKRRRKRRSVQEIGGIIAEYERSGITQHEFAETWGIPLATLTGWLRRARQGRFVEVRTEAKANLGVSAGHFAVELAAGIRIEVPRGFDPLELGALLVELKGAGCLP